MTKEELTEIKRLRERLALLEQKKEDMASEIADLQVKIGQYEAALDTLRRKLGLTQTDEKAMPFFGVPVESLLLGPDVLGGNDG